MIFDGKQEHVPLQGADWGCGGKTCSSCLMKLECPALQILVIEVVLERVGLQQSVNKKSSLICRLIFCRPINVSDLGQCHFSCHALIFRIARHYVMVLVNIMVAYKVLYATSL